MPGDAYDEANQVGGRIEVDAAAMLVRWNTRWLEERASRLSPLRQLLRSVGWAQAAGLNEVTVRKSAAGDFFQLTRDRINTQQVKEYGDSHIHFRTDVITTSASQRMQPSHALV
jgi:hypothetical protein